MLTADVLQAIDEAAQQVASVGWGVVALVIEHGQVTRLQQQTDLRLDRRARPDRRSENSTVSD